MTRLRNAELEEFEVRGSKFDVRKEKNGLTTEGTEDTEQEEDERRVGRHWEFSNSSSAVSVSSVVNLFAGV